MCFYVIASQVAMHDIEHGKDHREQFQIAIMHTLVLTQMVETIRGDSHQSVWILGGTLWTHQTICYNLANLSAHP